jgi:hypothetical protein
VMRYWTRQMEQCVSGRGPTRAAAGLGLGGLTIPNKAPAPGRLVETPDSQCSKSAENGA